MQSCSRAVIAIFIMLLSVNAVADTAEILDAEDDIRSEVQDFVHIFIEEPGHLVVDASGARGVLPLHDDILVFSDREEYEDFLVDTLGVKFEIDEEGQVIGTLTVSVIGRVFSYDQGLAELVAVSSPISTMIGGRTGIVEVGGTQFCVNEVVCGPSVDPLTLWPRVAEEDPERESGSANQITSASEVSIVDRVAASSSGSSSFRIGASLTFYMNSYEVSPYTEKYQTVATAVTTQVSGGYQILSVYYPPPKIVCEPPKGTLILKPVCWWIPSKPVVLTSKGSNRLDVDFERLSYYYDNSSRQCSKMRVARPKPVWEYNVPEVFVEDSWWVTSGYGRKTTEYRRTFPSEIVSNHDGEDMKTRAYDYKRLKWFPWYAPECRP